MSHSSEALIFAGTEPDRVVRTFATVGTVIVAVILLSYWPSYNHVVQGGRSTLFYYVLPGLIAMLLIFLRPEAAIRLLHEPMVWWFIAYVISGMAWLILSQDFPTQAGQEWRLRLLACLVFLTVLYSCMLGNLRLIALAIAGCVALAGVLNWVDIMFPFYLVPLGVPGVNPGRAAGLFINSNISAAFIVMGTIAALPLIPMTLRAGLLLVALIGVAPTFSRFGWLFAPLIVAVAVVLKLLDRKQLVLIFIAIPALVAGAALYYQFAVQSANANLLERLDWFESFGRHADFSVRERAYVAQQAWEKFLESPVVGQGIGVTLSKGERVGTHNMYVLLMAEQGLAGLALYLSLIWLLVYKGWQLVRTSMATAAREVGATLMLYGAFIAMFGFVSHNVLEDAHGMFILAFMVALGRRAQQSAVVEDRQC